MAAETPGQTMGRNLRPQRASTRGLQQNQAGNGMDSFLQGAITNYTNAFQGAQNAGATRIRDAATRDLIARGINDSATGVDIANRNLSDYTAQSNLGLAQNILPLYQAIAAMAAQADEAERNRGFQTDMFGLNRDLQLDVLGRTQGHNVDMFGRNKDLQLDVLGRTQGFDSEQSRLAFERQKQLIQQQLNQQLQYQRDMLPINEQAYRSAYQLEQQLNPPQTNYNPYMAAVNSANAQTALSQPILGGLTPTPSGPWDPSQGAPSSSDRTGNWVYSPGTGTWAPAGQVPQTSQQQGFDLTSAEMSGLGGR